MERLSPDVRLEGARRLRARNLATLALLLGLVVLFFAVTLVRLGGAAAP